MRGNEPIHSYDLWKKNLPSKLEVRQAENFFHHTEKKICGHVICLDCLNMVFINHWFLPELEF